MTKAEFHRAMLKFLDSVKEEHGQDAVIQLRTDDYGVIIRDITSRKILYDADTLAEFTFKYFPVLTEGLD